MSKPKFASLTAGLLARKGEAMPTAQPFASLVPALAPPAAEPPPSRSGGLASLIQRANPLAGAQASLREIRRMPEQAAPVAMEPVSVEIAPEQSAPAAEPVSYIRPALTLATPRMTRPHADTMLSEAHHRRHGVTVRLDGPRHRRLMIVSTRYGRTYQDILARALDVYMTALGIEDPGPPQDRLTRKPRS